MTVAERRKRAADLYGEGLSARKVAEAIGRSESVVLGYLKAEGVQLRRSKAPEWEERVCGREGCNERFRPAPALVRKGFGIYCGQECEAEARRKYPAAEPRVCGRDGCDNVFTPTASNVAYGWGKYCSPRCSALSTRAHEKRAGRMVACRHCGKEEWRYDCQIGQNPHGEFCTRECWNKWRWEQEVTISPRVISLDGAFVRPETRRRRARIFGRGAKQLAAEKGKRVGRKSEAEVFGDRILELRANGKSEQAIANIIGLSKPAVHRFLAKSRSQ